MERLTRKHTYKNLTFGNSVWLGQYASSEIIRKNYLQKSYIWRPERHMDVFCMDILRLFSSGINPFLSNV